MRGRRSSALQNMTKSKLSIRKRRAFVRFENRAGIRTDTPAGEGQRSQPGSPCFSKLVFGDAASIGLPGAASESGVCASSREMIDNSIMSRNNFSVRCGPARRPSWVSRETSTRRHAGASTDPLWPPMGRKNCVTCKIGPASGSKTLAFLEGVATRPAGGPARSVGHRSAAFPALSHPSKA